MLEKKPFKTYSLDEEKEEPKREVISLSLSQEEREQLKQDKKIIQQSKDGTALKQLWKIGSKVIHDKKTREIIHIILGNKRRNKRIGNIEFE